jgi:purine nucleosidase
VLSEISFGRTGNGGKKLQSRKKIIVDCDVGVDDALALILAFHSPELEVLAITGVNGNVSLGKVMKNIEKVLFLLKPSGRPIIARGAENPLKGSPVHAESFHGEDGLGGVNIQPGEEEEWWKVFPGSAEELFATLARRHPGEITLIAIGPLTNLALALAGDPDGVRQLKEMVIMGGALREKGNITPYAEFNFYVDPLAAARVLNSGVPITLVPLDITHKVPLTPEVMAQRIRPMGDSFSRFVIEATGYDAREKRFREGRKVFYLHDPLAVGAVIRPRLIRMERLPVFVETAEGERYGQIHEVFPKQVAVDQKVEVGLEVRAGEFMELFLARLKG